jgi:hypothetical protein
MRSILGHYLFFGHMADMFFFFVVVGGVFIPVLFPVNLFDADCGFYTLRI